MIRMEQPALGTLLMYTKMHREMILEQLSNAVAVSCPGTE
jgi:hypothetical protein